MDIYIIYIYIHNGLSQKKEWNIAICKQHGWTQGIPLLSEISELKTNILSVEFLSNTAF